MHTIIFLSLDALLPGHLEPAFRSLMALRNIGLDVPISKNEQAEFACDAVVCLMAIAREHQARFVFTSLYAPEVEADVIRKHLEYLGLSDMAACLAENWSTSIDRSTSRVSKIRSWRSQYASLEDAYVVIDTDSFAREFMESDFSEHVVIIDSESPDFSTAAKRVREVLGAGAGHA